MKSIYTIFLLLSVSHLFSQSNFESAILKGKEMIEAADTITVYQKGLNYFQRIAQKETDQWLPLYYQAQLMAWMASSEKDLEVKENNLNVALGLIAKGKQLDKNAELLALEGFVQMLRLTVDPATRGQTLSPTIFGLYNEALAMDSENPRALLFLGQMQYGSAQFFGSDFEEACANVKRACDIFEKQSDEPTIYPDWGRGVAQTNLDQCNQ